MCSLPQQAIKEKNSARENLIVCVVILGEIRVRNERNCEMTEIALIEDKMRWFDICNEDH